MLRDWLDEDLPVVRALATDDRVTRYQPWLRLHTDQACRRWLADAIESKSAVPRSAYSLAVVERSVGRTVGWLNWGDAKDVSKGAISFGYALLPEAWNRGYMTEAIRAMLTFVFDVQQSGSVYATCATNNPGSARVLEKAGLGLVYRWMQRDESLGLEEEHRRYFLKRTDWVSESV
jgi:RimJ/RimL family protein N-acetyltransferase